jgi:hypothetical protein
MKTVGYGILREARRSKARTSNGKDIPNLIKPFRPEKMKIASPHMIRNATVNPSTNNPNY